MFMTTLFDHIKLNIFTNKHRRSQYGNLIKRLSFTDTWDNLCN